jgi:hypothetical protein
MASLEGVAKVGMGLGPLLVKELSSVESKEASVDGGVGEETEAALKLLIGEDALVDELVVERSPGREDVVVLIEKRGARGALLGEGGGRGGADKLLLGDESLGSGSLGRGGRRRGHRLALDALDWSSGAIIRRSQLTLESRNLLEHDLVHHRVRGRSRLLFHRRGI